MVFAAATASVFFKVERVVHWTPEYVHEVFLHWRTLLYCLVFAGWFCLNQFYLMKFPMESTVRGFSLGATAGTLAGNMWCTKIVSEQGARCVTGLAEQCQ